MNSEELAGKIALMKMTSFLNVKMFVEDHIK